MSSSYRALLARPGARAVALSCGLGWLSFSSCVLAIVLAVEAATGSFAVAGSAAAAFTAGSACFAPLRGRTVDRRGPRALALFAPVHAAALLGLATGCATSASAACGDWPLVASAGVAGAFAPPLIATARVVWSEVAGPELARTGHALNAALGDAAQVAGPALTGLIAATTSPLVALAAVIPGAAGGALLLAVTASARTRGPSRRAAAPHRVRGAAGGSDVAGAPGASGALRASAGLRTLVGCEVVLGVWLGALEVAAPALAAQRGAAALGAVPLAAFAAGAVAASLWSGRGRRRAAAARYLSGSIAVAAVLPLCLLVPSPAGLAGVAAAAGAGFGLLNTALFELLDELVASDRAVEAFTWLTSGAGAGFAVGAASAGQLAHGGHGGAAMLFLVAVPPAAGAAIALAGRATLRPAARG